MIIHYPILLFPYRVLQLFFIIDSKKNIIVRSQSSANTLPSSCRTSNTLVRASVGKETPEYIYIQAAVHLGGGDDADSSVREINTAGDHPQAAFSVRND